MMEEVKYPFSELDKKRFSLLAKRGYEPKVIFDVGAMNGYWSHHINEVFPNSQYHLFEPLIPHLPDYQTKIAQNLQNHPNFTAHSYALGEKTADIKMFIFDQPAASTNLALKNKDGEHKEILVKCLTIEDAIKMLNIPVPQIIKIDTQGSELPILKGASNILHKVDVLLLETWLFQGYGVDMPLLTDLADWLLKFNFRLWDIADCYRNPDGVLSTVDCIFVNVDAGFAPHWYYPDNGFLTGLKRFKPNKKLLQRLFR
jgi:FkbM family methyltransferase